jgi:predicted nucleic acid-binding Zn finger protein
MLTVLKIVYQGYPNSPDYILPEEYCSSHNFITSHGGEFMISFEVINISTEEFNKLKEIPVTN